jgi:hypothetical protein
MLKKKKKRMLKKPSPCKKSDLSTPQPKHQMGLLEIQAQPIFSWKKNMNKETSEMQNASRNEN